MTRPVDVTRYRPVPLERRREPADLLNRAALAERLDAAEWVVARVMAGREGRAIADLNERGVFAFTPVNEVWRRVSATDRHKTLRRFPAAPGYVVAALERPFPRWASLYACPSVVEVLTATGRAPRLLARAEVERLADLGRRAADYHQHMPSRREWDAAPGDALVILQGPFEGMRARLDKPLGPRGRMAAIIVVGLFGGGVAAEAPVEWLRPE